MLVQLLDTVIIWGNVVILCIMFIGMSSMICMYQISVWCFGLARPSSGSDHVSDTNRRLPFFFSCYVFLLGFLSFLSDSEGQDFCLELLPGIPELPYSKWSWLTPASYLLSRRERTTPRNQGALSVWFISTLLWGATAFCCCWFESPISWRWVEVTLTPRHHLFIPCKSIYVQTFPHQQHAQM
jgi:hypothetical protein